MSDLNRMISETYEFNVVDVDFTCDENNLPTNSNYFFQQQQQQQQQQKEKQPNARKSSSSTSSSRPNQSILSCSQNNVQIDATIISANTNCPTSSSSDSGENFFNRTLDDDPNASVNTVTHKYHNNKQPVEHYSNNLNPNSESTLTTPTTATTSPNQYGYNLLSSTVNRMDDKEAVISRMNKKASYFDLDNTRRGRNGRKDDDETLPENSVLEANNQQLTTALNTTGCRSSLSCESSAICDTTNITTAAPLDDEDDDEDASVSLSTTAANNAALASCMTMATTANTTTVKRDHFKKQKQSVVSVVEKCETTKPREKKEQKFHRTRLLNELKKKIVGMLLADQNLIINVNQSINLKRFLKSHLLFNLVNVI